MGRHSDDHSFATFHRHLQYAMFLLYGGSALSCCRYFSCSLLKKRARREENVIHRWNPRLPGNTYWSEPETSEFRLYQLSVALPSIKHHHLRIAMWQLIATWSLGLFSHVWYKEQKSDEESILFINTLYCIDQTQLFQSSQIFENIFVWRFNSVVLQPSE